MSKNRTERLQLRVSPEEKAAIRQKADDANMSEADYIVALSANQKIIDAKIIAQLILEIRRIGVNVNQIAEVANYQKFVNKEMLSKVNDGQNQIIDLLMKILSEVYDTETHSIRININQKKILFFLLPEIQRSIPVLNLRLFSEERNCVPVH